MNGYDIAEFLRTSIIKNGIVDLDLWSFLHLFAGMLVVYLVYILLTKKRFRVYGITLGLLVAWEVLEVVLYKRPIPIIYPETLIDVVWDIIVGMMLGLLYKIHSLNYLDYLMQHGMQMEVKRWLYGTQI